MSTTSPWRCGAILLTALTVLAGTGCGRQSTDDGRIHVVATTGMVADLARHVGGDRVQVTQIMKAGVDPHLYKASPGDIRLLSDADLILYNGLHLEGKLSEILANVGKRKPAYGVAEFLPKDKVMQDPEKGFDPHVWFDVSLWNDARAVVAEKLIELDPGHADEYRQRSEAYGKELAALDDYARERIATIPKQHRVLITAHDAFSYFGRAYAIDVKGIQGISTEAEASVKRINELVDFIADNGIKAVFAESSVNDKGLQALKAGCAARGHEVEVVGAEHHGNSLFSDAMGEVGTPEGTYAGMVRHNVDVIVDKLK